MSGEPRPWSPARIGWWALAASLACVAFGPGFVRALLPPPGGVVDFFQEWASARNVFNGLPVYANQAITVQRYLGMERLPPGNFFLEVNAHPPTSVLLALPLAGLPYPQAFFVWNVASLAALALSLWLIARQLAIRCSAWSVLPAIALLLICNPLQQQINQGQLNLFLLLLLTGAWAAHRSRRSVLAGVLLGTATAVKLFPGFLFGYFIVRGRWRSVAIGLLAEAGWTALTVAVLGLDSYRSYVHHVLPQVERFWDWWLNASLTGFWFRLFDGASGHVVPLLRAPGLARVAVLASDVLLVLLLMAVIAKARTRAQRDQAFGATMIAMLLVSPVTWDHYLLLLALPLVLLWRSLPGTGVARWVFRAVLAIVWMPPVLFWQPLIGARMTNWTSMVAQPWQSVTALSLQFYALIALFALALTEACRQAARTAGALGHEGSQPIGIAA
jgi:hypothetical protein